MNRADSLTQPLQFRGLLFITPVLLFFSVFIVYPVLYIFYLGMFDWDGINDSKFILFKNYIKLFSSDRVFWISLRNAAYWAPLTIISQMVLGFIVAFLLEIRTPFVTILRTIFFIPTIISPIIVGILWQQIYNPFGGLLSDIGYATGFDSLTYAFLADTRTAVFAVIVVNVWQWMGFSMLIYIAGIKSLPKSVLDMAKIDGLSMAKMAMYVVWPMLKHVHLTLILLGVIGTMQTFPLIYSLTSGGPNHATEMLPNYIFQQGFLLHNMGYASAISVVLFIISIGLSILQIKFLKVNFINKELK